MAIEQIIKVLSEADIPVKSIKGDEAQHFIKQNPNQLLRGCRFDIQIPIFAIWPENDFCDLNLLALSNVNDIQIIDLENNIENLNRFMKQKIVISKRVKDMEQVAIASEIKKQVVIVSGTDFCTAMGEYVDIIDFSVPREKLFQADGSSGGQFTSMRIKKRIEETFDLPAMPQVAQELMKLRVDPRAEAEDLANIIDKDPSLAAQVISWASSPYYGYRGTVNSTQVAIARVLGFEMVMNLSLGLSLGKAVDAELDGPLGLNKYWQHAICCATLSSKLARMMDSKYRPDIGLVYLSGLLHNFGHLAFALLFRPLFGVLNNHILANPSIAVHHLEKQILGVTHCEVGAWLFENWHMPAELLAAAQWHHKEEFWNEYGAYSNLIYLSNALLKSYNIGDAESDFVSPQLLSRLGLEFADVIKAQQEVMEQIDELLAIGKQIAA